MSARRTPRPSKRPGGGRADPDYLGKLTDEEIGRTAPADLPIFPDTFWDKAVVVRPEPKIPISVRVDRDVLDWFRAQGPRYQSRMNAVLRSYMESMRHSPKKRSGSGR